MFDKLRIRYDNNKRKDCSNSIYNNKTVKDFIGNG